MMEESNKGRTGIKEGKRNQPWKAGTRIPKSGENSRREVEAKGGKKGTGTF
jgi:hypothetical protein